MAEEAPGRCEFDSSTLLLQKQFDVPATISAISPMVDDVMAVVRQTGCAEGRELDVEIAVREALANAIKHGARHDPRQKVQCTVSCDEARGMLIVVRDGGQGFDPSLIPSPTLGQNLFAHHGRGIYLINQLMDEVRFERGGTEIHMLKRPPDSKAP